MVLGGEAANCLPTSSQERKCQQSCPGPHAAAALLLLPCRCPQVPFVDCITTISDESIPLTVIEWEE